jgi:hypothetical protein
MFTPAIKIPAFFLQSANIALPRFAQKKSPVRTRQVSKTNLDLGRTIIDWLYFAC